MKGKRASESRTVLTDIVLPPDTNGHGTIFGGKVMAYVDKLASIAAMRHCRCHVVTASTDSLDFLAPVKLGQAISVEAFVSWTHKTSMEVFVKIRSEDLMTGEWKLTGTSYLTFVALDEQGRPVEVPPVIPESEEEKWHFEGAPERYRLRQERRRNAKTQNGFPAAGNV
jgi:acyl-CoA hydrolase